MNEESIYCLYIMYVCICAFQVKKRFEMIIRMDGCRKCIKKRRGKGVQGLEEQVKGITYIHQNKYVCVCVSYSVIYIYYYYLLSFINSPSFDSVRSNSKFTALRRLRL